MASLFGDIRDWSLFEDKWIMSLFEDRGCRSSHQDARKVEAVPDIAINAFWHAKFHRDPANQWLRSLVFELFGGDGR